MDDYISRQAAIDSLHTRFKDGFDEDKWWNSTHVLAAIKGLPSAQPEIIRCKECKYYHPSYCEIWSKYGTVQTREMGYCYMAERREDGT